MNTILRITRHPLTTNREDWLRQQFGDDIEIVADDVPYGDNPAGAVMSVVNRCTGDVVAVEASGPETKMIPIAKALAERGIPLIRQVYQRDESGRVVITGQDERGRDIFAFDRYEAVEAEVREALIGRPLPSIAAMAMRRAVDGIIPAYRAFCERAAAERAARETPKQQEVKALLVEEAKRQAPALLEKALRTLVDCGDNAEFYGDFIVETDVDTHTPTEAALQQAMAIDPAEYELGDFFAAALCAELTALADDPSVSFSFDQGEGDYYDPYRADVIFSLNP